MNKIYKFKSRLRSISVVNNTSTKQMFTNQSNDNKHLKSIIITRQLLNQN